MERAKALKVLQQKASEIRADLWTEGIPSRLYIAAAEFTSILEGAGIDAVLEATGNPGDTIEDMDKAEAVYDELPWF